MAISKQVFEELEAAAKRAARNAYCRYSGFRVGAAVLSEADVIHPGTNVENASYGLTICAERNAIFRAVAEGARSVRALVVYTPTSAPVPPCGACRQVITEFGPDVEVISVCDSGAISRSTIKDLLPISFGPSELLGENRDDRRICIDIDNVIAQTDAIMREVIREVTNHRVNLTYENVRRFNYWECQDPEGKKISKEEWHMVHSTFSKSRYLSTIQPVPGVQASLSRLTEHYSLHFATSRLPEARTATIRWLEDNEFPPHDLHFLKHGEKHFSLGRFDASVEDDPDQATAFSKSGIGINFVIAHPWNESVVEHRNLRRVPGWNEIVEMLLGDSTSQPKPAR